VRGKYYDVVNFSRKYKAGMRSLFLDLKRWRKFTTRYRLDWEKARFTPENQDAIPKQRGIYVFTAELSPAKLPPHGYILYVGIAGDKSAGTLYKRYGQYLREGKEANNRPAIVYMLKNWEKDLFFNFVPLPKTSIDLARMESAFINAIIPPFNERDVNAEVFAARAAGL
jgi:hypothetical protein